MKTQFLAVSLLALSCAALPAQAQSVDVNLEVVKEVAAAASQMLAQQGYKGSTTVTAAGPARGLPWTLNNLTYGEMIRGPVKPLSAQQAQAKNCSGTDQQAVLQFDRTLSEGASWTVTNGVHVGTTLSVTATLPGAEIGASVSLDFTTETSSSTSSQVDYGFTFAQTVNVPSKSKMSGTLVVDTQTVQMPWTANVALDATKVRGADLLPYLATTDMIQHTAVLTRLAPLTLADILGKKTLTFQIGGTYQSVDASDGNVVWSAEAPVTAQDCGGPAAATATVQKNATNTFLAAKPAGNSVALKPRVAVRSH